MPGSNIAQAELYVRTITIPPELYTPPENGASCHAPNASETLRLPKAGTSLTGMLEIETQSTGVQDVANEIRHRMVIFDIEFLEKMWFNPT